MGKWILFIPIGACGDKWKDSVAGKVKAVYSFSNRANTGTGEEIMIIDFEVLASAVRAGNWVLIPVIILCLGIFAVAGIGIPFVLNRLFKPPAPSSITEEKPKDFLRRWWSGFKYAIAVLQRFGIIILVTFFLCFFIFCFSGSII